MSEQPTDIEVSMLSACFDARSGSESALAGVLARYVVMTRHEPGCRNVDMVASATIGGRFLLLQKWDSADLVQLHLDSQLMASMAAEAVPLLARKPEIDLYDTISAHDLA